MKIETLKERIKNTKNKIDKINATIEKHNKQLKKKGDKLTEQGVNLQSYDRYNYRQTNLYWDICDYEDKLEAIESNNKKLKDANTDLQKYQEQLKNQLAKDAETENIIPPVLNEFLANWKAKAFEYYIQLANEYIAEYHKKYDITKEGLELLTIRKRIGKTWNYETIQKYTDAEIEEILKSDLNIWEKEKFQNAIKNSYWKMFLKFHFDSDIAVIEKIVECYESINEKILNKILDDEVKEKREMFISRVKEVIGEIKDLNGLHIGDNGEINGIAKGVKCNAKVNTITAGGYNIQCYHFRVLVNTIKGDEE